MLAELLANLPYPYTLTRQRQAKERGQLLHAQRSLWGRLRRAVDLTGGVKRRDLDARRTQITAHRKERADLAKQSRSDRLALREALSNKYVDRRGKGTPVAG